MALKVFSDFSLGSLAAAAVIAATCDPEDVEFWEETFLNWHGDWVERFGSVRWTIKSCEPEYYIINFWVDGIEITKGFPPAALERLTGLLAEARKREIAFEFGHPARNKG